MDIVGPICESGDFFAMPADPLVSRGQRLAIFSAGADGFAIQPYSRPCAAEVLVSGDSFRVIRKRETYEDLIALERWSAEKKRVREKGRGPTPLFTLQEK